MPNPSNDDAARRLERLSGGAGPSPSSQPVQRPRTPQPVPQRPAQPVVPAPQPQPAGAVPKPARPVVRPAAPPVRPAAPTAPQPKATPHKAPDLAIADDDSVIVPAPDASVFLHKPDYAPRRVKSARAGVSLKFRQTFIPILLTGGFILIVLAALHFLWVADNDPMAGIPMWMVGIMIALGLGLWGLAAMNMMAVRQILRAGEPRVRPPA